MSRYPLRAGLLRGNGSFRRYWLSCGAESIADDVCRTLLPLIAVGVLGVGSTAVGALHALSLGAFLVLGMPAGALVDRIRTRRAMMLAAVVRCLAIVTVPAAYAFEVLSIAQVLVVAGVIGVADLVFTTAGSVLLADIVPGEQLQTATARVQSVQSVGTIVAPAASSALLRVVAAPWVALSGGLAYLASALALRGIPEPGPGASRPEAGPQPDPARRGGLSLGIRLVWHDPVLRALMLSGACVNAGVMLVNVALPVWLLDRLHLGLATVAALGVVQAGAALVGSAIAVPLVCRIGIGRAKIVAAPVTAAGLVLVPLAAILPGAALPWVALGQVVSGAVTVVLMVAGSGIMPRLTPRQLLGRVSAGTRMVVLGVMPAVGLLGGLIGERVGVVWLLCAGPVAVAGSALAVLVSPLRAVHDLSDLPAAREVP